MHTLELLPSGEIPSLAQTHKRTKFGEQFRSGAKQQQDVFQHIFVWYGMVV